MPYVLIALGAAALLGFAFSRRGEKTSRRPAPPPEAVNQAAAALEAGTPTAEDLETLGDAADAAGEPEAADAFYQAAASAPEAQTMVEPELEHEEPPEAAPVFRTPDDEQGAPLAAPSPTPVRVDAPPGFNPPAAHSMAQRVADDIRSRQYSYDRQLLKDFQRAAGITVDGHYGAGSGQALIFFEARNVPRPLFRPRTAPIYEEAHPHLVNIMRGA